MGGAFGASFAAAGSSRWQKTWSVPRSAPKAYRLSGLATAQRAWGPFCLRGVTLDPPCWTNDAGSPSDASALIGSAATLPDASFATSTALPVPSTSG
jgi:hypothetical protein